MVNKDSVQDGKPISVQSKNIGSTESYALKIRLSNDGRHLALKQNSEYVISPTSVFRRISGGNCTEVDWNTNGDYFIKEGNNVKVFKAEGNFEDVSTFKTGFVFENIFGGPYLCLFKKIP